MTTRTESGSERPRQIIGATLKVFARNGLTACMPDVADEAGDSRGKLYLYPDSADIEQRFEPGARLFSMASTKGRPHDRFDPL
jgi:AcrR family transcriptional regulator